MALLRVRSRGPATGVAAATGRAGSPEPPSSNSFPGVDRAVALMQPSNDSLRKAVRTRAAFEDADRVALAADARRLMTLAGELSAETEPAEAFSLPQERWATAVDSFREAAEDLSRQVENPDATQPQLRRAFIRLQTSCIECHTVFRW